MKPTRIDRTMLGQWGLPELGIGGDKEARGSVLVVAGCAEMPGAASLAAEATLRAGAGKLQVAVPKSVSTLVASAVPEAKVTGFAESRRGGPTARCIEALLPACAQVDALLIGPGMEDETAVRKLVEALLAAEGQARCVVDAAGLAVLHGGTYRFPRTAIVTPHAGEMAQIVGAEREAIESDPARHALEVSARVNSVVVMKGISTHIAAPDGRLWCFDDGHVGLGMSGSGDVLAGLITGLLARGASLEQAAVWAVALHGYAGQALGTRVGRVGYLARELAAEVPRIMENLRSA